MKIFRDKVLKDLTNFKIGGNADYFLILDNLDDLIKFWNWFKEKKISFFILGGGTNLLINNFNGIIIKPNFNFIQTKLTNNGYIRVGSSVLVEELLSFVINLGYQGLEWAGGLPGTVGGAIEGGVGCFGGEFRNLVLEVEAFNLKTGEYKKFLKDECEFDYRNSFFRKNKEWLIIATTLFFETNCDIDLLKKTVQEKIDYRQKKHPLEYPNAGSVFKNYPFTQAPKFIQDLALEKNKVKNDPFPIIPIAFLISELGLKGKRIGDAQVSEKHANFIVNLGNASFNDVVSLIDYVQKKLEDKFLIEPEIEIQIVSNEKLLTF